MEVIPAGIDAGYDSCFDGLFVIGRAIATIVFIPARVSQERKGNVRDRNTVHRAATSVWAVTHRATDSFHPMAVLDHPTLHRDSGHVNSLPVLQMGHQPQTRFLCAHSYGCRQKDQKASARKMHTLPFHG